MWYLERDLEPGEEVVYVSMKDHAGWYPTGMFLLVLGLLSGLGLAFPTGDARVNLNLPVIGGALFIPYFLLIAMWWRNSGVLLTDRRILPVDLTLRGRVQGSIPLGIIREAKVDRIRYTEWVSLRRRDGGLLNLHMILRPHEFVDAVNDQVAKVQDAPPGEVDLPHGVYLGLSDLAILAHGVYGVVLAVLIKIWGPL
jgi:hypothetical protein